MLTLIIALLMNLGLIDTPADYHNSSSAQQEQYQEIVGEDLSQL
ncbi:MAG: hypothetical protein AB8H03_22170 [Saprospiraceae bacterium]